MADQARETGRPYPLSRRLGAMFYPGAIRVGPSLEFIGTYLLQYIELTPDEMDKLISMWESYKATHKDSIEKVRRQ